MSFGGLSNLGGSVFTLKVDDTQLVAGLSRAEAAARAASNRIGGDLTRGSKAATQGMLQLGYAVDDLQYGFGAIANNLPMIAMGFGMSAGIAGSVAIAATIVNQLIHNWGDLSTLLAGSATGTIPSLSGATEQLTGQLKKLDDEILKLSKDQAGLNTLDLQRLSVLKQVSERGHAFVSAERDVAGMRSEQETEMGAAFTKAAGKIPGGASALVAMLVQNGMSVEDATNAVAGAAKGKGGALEDILPHVPGEAPYLDLFRATGEGVAREKQEKEDLKEAEAVKNREKQRTSERQRLEERLNQEGMKNEEQGKRDQLDQEKRDMQDQIKRGEHLLTAEGKKQLQDRLLGGVAPQSSSVMSAKAASDKLLTDSFNKVPEKQLKKLTEMHATLKNIDTRLRALGLQ